MPDLGRCGISEALGWSRVAGESEIEVVPHVSIAMGPQIAGGLHFSAAAPNCPLVEYNPKVLETANRFLKEPIVMERASYGLPTGAGLGAEMTNVDGLCDTRERKPIQDN